MNNMKKSFLIILMLTFLASMISGCCCCCCSWDKIFDEEKQIEEVSSNNNDNNEENNNETKDTGSPSTGKLKAMMFICDNYISSENNEIKEGTKRDYILVNQLLDRLDKRNIIPVEKQVFKGKEANRYNILKAIKDLKVNDRDVLFFYYSGHGGMTGGSLYLYPCDENTVYRSDIQEAINAKKARFKMIITDACSSSIDSVSYNNRIGYRRLLMYMGNIANEETYDEEYKNLFLNYKGLLDITAATEGQYAWYTGDGGIFSISLFEELLLQSPSNNWKEIINQTKEKTQAKFKEMYDMGMLSDSDKEDMAAKNITNQEPKSFSEPEMIDNNISSNENNTYETPEDKTDVNTEVNIKNATDYIVTFNVDNNIQKNAWNAENNKEIALQPQESINLKDNKKIKVYYDKGNKKTEYYELDGGSYYFGLNADKMLQLFIGEPTAVSSNNSVLIYNFDSKPVNFLIKYDNGSESNYTLEANQSKTLDINNKLDIYFNDSSYELNPGYTYYFAANEYKRVDLYVSE